ncbi:MAG: hemolysin family protein [Pseudomonadota bacterium]
MSPAHLLLLGLVGVAGGASAMAPQAIAPSLLLLTCLLALSGFFSSSETAIFGLQAYDIEVLRERSASGRLLERMRSRPQRLLATILMGNELVNVTLSSVAAALVVSLFPRQPWLNVVLVVPLLLLFGEVLPKSLAIRFSRRWALAICRPLHVVYLIFAPLRWLVDQVASVITRLFGVRRGGRPEGLREEDLRTLVDMGLEQGALNAAEQELIHAVFELDDLPVGRIMTPRADLVTLDLRTPWPDMLAAVKENGLSRIPVYVNDRDNIIGILMTKDLLRFLGRPPPNLREVRQILHAPHYVPIFKRADELLEEFRKQRVHMALVVDEHGSTAGLVTMDDLLAELLGELQDESDDGSEEVRLDPDGSMLVDGAMDIEDFSALAGSVVPDGDYSTVGGFFLSLTRSLPEQGQQVTWSGLTFEVVEVTGRRIATLRVRHEAAPPEAPVEEPAP